MAASMHTAGGNQNLWINTSASTGTASSMTGTASSMTGSTFSNTISTDDTSWIAYNTKPRRSLTTRKRLLIQGVSHLPLLPYDGAKVCDKVDVNIVFDEVVNMLTPEGVEAVNNIVGELDFLSFKAINFEGMLQFRDGSMLRLHKDGNYDIMDNAANIIYKNRNIRDYNRFIDGSSLLEEFIKDCGIAGIKQSEFMNITIEVFIHWLIYKAALKDDDPLPEGVYAPGKHPETTKLKWPHCRSCGKFISPAFVEVGINFCNEVCMLTKRPLKTSVLQIARQAS